METFSPGGKPGSITVSPGSRSTIAARPLLAKPMSALFGTVGHGRGRGFGRRAPMAGRAGHRRPESVMLTGWSYGGYLTLQTLGRYPDLWAGGMSGIAIADWTVMYEDEAETLRGYQRSLFGGTPQEKPEAHAAASPITYAEDVRAPIYIIQGSNDTRCPARQMRGYEEKIAFRSAMTSKSTGSPPGMARWRWTLASSIRNCSCASPIRCWARRIERIDQCRSSLPDFPRLGLSFAARFGAASGDAGRRDSLLPLFPCLLWVIRHPV